MQDPAKFERNMRRLVQGGASDDEIRTYMESEGVSEEQALALDTSSAVPQWVQNVGEAVQDVGQGIYDLYQGKQDPNYKDTPEFSEWAIPSGAGNFAHSDEAYTDVIQKRLENESRFVSRKTDANGYPLITYKDEDGNQKTEYTNRPGLQFTDVQRTIDGSLPFVVGGGAASMAARAIGATGLTSNALLQGVGQSGASVASDLVAQQQGSQQPVDTMKAMVAGAGGAAGSLVPLQALPLAGAAAGTATGAGATYLGEEPTPEKYVVNSLLGGLAGGAAGKLLKTAGAIKKDAGTVGVDGAPDEKLKETVRKAGIDTSEVTPEELEQFRQSLERGASVSEANASKSTKKFGIETTLGQRSKDPEQLLLEKEARYGVLGPDAKKDMAKFDQQQADQIQEAALGTVDPNSTSLSVGKKFSGDQLLPPTHPSQFEPSRFGDNIQRHVQQAKAFSDDVINDAWQGISALEPTREGLETLPGVINRALGDDVVDPVITPNAARMIDDLGQYMQGQLTVGQRLGEGGQGVVRSIDTMRRRLLQLSKAADPSDRRVATKIYNAFADDFVDTIAEQAFVNGNPAMATKLKAARDITKELKQLFGPTDGRKLSPGGKIIQRIVDDPHSAEDVIGLVMGRSGPKSAPMKDSIQALDILNNLTGARTHGGSGARLLSQTSATRVKSDLKLAYWGKLVVDKSGEMHAPHMIIDNISSALQNQRKILSRLYSSEEVELIRSFRRAMQQVAAKDPNPSGSATAVAKRINRNTNAVKEILGAQAQREALVKARILMSRIYRFFAKSLPVNIAGSRDFLGAAAVRQSIKPNPSPTTPVPSILGGVLGEKSIAER